jgi:CARDB
MLRVAATIAALAAFPPASSAARGVDSPLPPTVAKVVGCDFASSDRSATFVARMDAIPSAAKLAIRFQLLERLGRGDTWHRLDVPALRAWHISQAGVQHFAWTQTVDNLRIGGAYKTHVLYRWLASNGAVVGTDTRDSPTCRGPLPNIVVDDLTSDAGPTADTRTYRVAVQNSGKVAADDVDVSLAVDGAMLDTVTLSHLAVGETRFATFTGPACERGIRATADPDNTIGESLETDNSQAFACP